MNIPSVSQLSASCHHSVLHPPSITRYKELLFNPEAAGVEIERDPLSLSLRDIQPHCTQDSNHRWHTLCLHLAGPSCWQLCCSGLPQEAFRAQQQCHLFCLVCADFSKSDQGLLKKCFSHCTVNLTIAQ